jgi:transcriptional antiterminator RfaH
MVLYNQVSAYLQARLKDRMSQTASAKWYLLQCKPRQEARAEENLRNQAFTCYSPRHPVAKIRHGKRVTVAEPLFPGYLFIQLCEYTESWHPIRSTRGVLRLVTFAYQAVPVADDIVNGIQSRLAQAYDGERPNGKPLFAAGQAVTVTDGPFRDIEAIFSSLDGEERAIILLSLMQRQQTIKVPLTTLRSTF